MLRAFGTDTAAAAAGTEKATPHGLASLPDTVMITQGPVLAAGVTQEQVMLCADTAPAGFDATDIYTVGSGIAGSQPFSYLAMFFDGRRY
jgi:hypothetical protein